MKTLEELNEISTDVCKELIIKYSLCSKEISVIGSLVGDFGIFSTVMESIERDKE